MNATVQIRLYTSPAKIDERSGYEHYFIAMGLGTLAVWKGEAVIITHDHWSFIQKAEIARFYNAQGELQMELKDDPESSFHRSREGSFVWTILLLIIQFGVK